MSSIVPNLRDLGGTVTVDGGVVRPGRLLRSAAPLSGDVAPDGVAWPPSLVIDLRSQAEIKLDHPLSSTGAQVLHLPLLAALRPGEAHHEDLDGLYRMVLDTAAPMLRDVVRAVGAHDGASLIHCAAGKDRTGISVAMLLRLVGVSRHDVVADYLLTAEHRAEIDARLGTLPGATHRAALPPAYFDVSAAAMVAVLDVWDSHPRGTHGWLVDAGGEQADVDRLARTLLA